MKRVPALFGFIFIAISGFSQSSSTIPADTKVTAFTNAMWLDGHSFKKKTG